MLAGYEPKEVGMQVLQTLIVVPEGISDDRHRQLLALFPGAQVFSCAERLNPGPHEREIEVPPIKAVSEFMTVAGLMAHLAMGLGDILTMAFGQDERLVMRRVRTYLHAGWWAPGAIGFWELDIPLTRVIDALNATAGDSAARDVVIELIQAHPYQGCGQMTEARLMECLVDA